MAEQSTNSESNFTTPADVRQIFKEELQGYFGPRGPEFSGGAGGKSNLPVGEVGSSGWSINRELDLVTRVTRVETSLEFLAKQMIEGFERMDKRFEDLIHQMDKRFEQVDKRFEQVDKRFEQVDKRFSLIQWTIGIGFIMMTVLMSVYQFLG